MEYWDENILGEITELLVKGELYLFAGAGLSIMAGLPSWSELIKQFGIIYKEESIRCSQKAPDAEIDSLVARNSLDIIDLVLDLGMSAKKKYVDLLIKNFTKPDICHDCHKILINLPFTGYVTTNYDLCFENACNAMQTQRSQTIRGATKIYPKHNKAPDPCLDTIWNLSSFLLHMHGCILYDGEYDVENIILTSRQYSSYYDNHMVNHIFDSLLRKNILILGASFTDRIFLDKFKAKRNLYNLNNIANSKTAYIICPDTEKNETPTIVKNLYDMRYSYFDKNDKNGLYSMIKDLRDMYESRKQGAMMTRGMTNVL